MLRRYMPFLRCREWLGCFQAVKLHPGVGRVLYSSFDKDLPNPNLPTPVSKIYTADADILLEQLKKAKTVERVLDLTSMHLDVMNARHIVACLEGIYEYSKEENLSNQSLMENKAFQSMCSRLMRIIRLLDPHELITTYKVLAGLGIRSNTYVMQSVLKMMGSRLNDMSLGQLTFLNFLLSKQRHNSLVDGLRLALPLVLQVQIEQQLDSENMTEVVNCLQLACRSRLRPATIQKILDAILKKAKALSPTNATTAVFALLNVETPLDGYKELLNHSFEVLAKNMELLDPNKVLAILRISSSQNFYHGRFCFSAVDKVVSEKWGLENTWEILKYFYKLSFCPSILMDHFAVSICSESTTFRTSLDYSPLSCVEYLTMSGYHPPQLEDALDVLLSCEDKLAHLEDKTLNLLIKFLSCITMLGRFPQSLLLRILDEEYLFSAWSKSRKFGRSNDFERNLLSLVWSLDVYDQRPHFSFPPLVLKNITQNACQKFSDFTSPLQKFIESGLGGSQFLKSGVLTHDGLLIDHVVAMRSGNYPVALDSAKADQHIQEVMFVEDINLPSDARIVAIIVANEEKYLRDPEVLKGWMDLKVKSLVKRNYSAVVINYANWRDLPDREKIPYLMREIKLAVQEDHTLPKATSLEIK